MVPVDGTAPFSVPAVRCSSPGVRVRQLISTALTIGFVPIVPVDARSSPLRIFTSASPNDVGFSVFACGYSAEFPTHFYIHQCAKSIINLMRLTVTLCMIVDVRVLPSGTTPLFNFSNRQITGTNIDITAQPHDKNSTGQGAAMPPDSNPAPK